MERLFDLAENQARLRPGAVMLASKIKGVWQMHSYKSIVQEAVEFANALLTLDLSNEITSPEKQEKIALVSENRPEWLITDLAVQQTGSVLVPIYPTISLQEFSFILNQAGVRILIVSGKELYERFQPAFKDIPQLKFIFSFDPTEGARHWKDLKGNSGTEHARLLLRKQISKKTLATIIYTSGTTGVPKGVMLSHENIVCNVEDSIGLFQFMQPGDKHLSFLPLNHIFEKMISYLCIHAGISIYYAESFDTIGENIKEVRPMVFTCVPRVMEKVYEKIVSKGHELTGLTKSLFFWALRLGKKYDTRKKGNLFYRFQLSLANKIIFSKWREALGNNIKVIVSGSAPLPDYLNRVFCSAKIPIMEGYGLTETSPVISVNRFEEKERVIGTVGEAIPNVEVKIAADGEILCRGKNIMLGYYKNEAETKAVIDKDGWFYTGDIGSLEEGKYLKITDRKKEMFKTSGGKYVAPQPIENKFKESRFVAQIMIVGPQRKFVAALIVPDFKNVYTHLKPQYPDLSDNPQKLIKEPAVVVLFQSILDKYNPQFNHVEQIKKFTLLDEEWTIENGILTPKLSLKRKVVNERFNHEIEIMYS